MRSTGRNGPSARPQDAGRASRHKPTPCSPSPDRTILPHGRHHHRDGHPRGAVGARARGRALAGDLRATPSRSSWCSRCGRSWRGPACSRRSCFPRWSRSREAFVNLTIRGILPHHVLDTVLRLLAGFFLAAIVGVDARHPDGPLAPGRGHRAAAGQHRRADPRPRLCAAVSAVVRARQQIGGAAGRLRLGVSDHLQHLDRREGGEGNLGALGAGDGRRRPPPVRQGDRARRAALHPDRIAARPGAGLAHPGRHRDAGRGAVGARLDDLRRARIPQHRRRCWPASW